LGIIAVPVAILLFLPALHNVGYVQGYYDNLPISFKIMRDQIYEIVLACGVILGLGVGGLYVWEHAGKVE
jgi:hypothetical protein